MDDWDALPISLLAQTGYCMRRAALLTNEQAWSDNADTVKGRLEHERVHAQRVERRGNEVKLFETIYVLTPDSYLFHRNENICISIGGEEKASVPATQVDGIVFFGKNSLSTSLIGFCGTNDITLSFHDVNGRFYGRVCGPVSGNVLLRKRQYDKMDDEEFSITFVRDLLYGKLRNSKMVLMRHSRTSKQETTAQELICSADKLSEIALQLSSCTSIDSMRGLEGAAASIYFAQFDNMLSSSRFRFAVRSRRPPQNEVNAALSFVYTMLTHDVRSATESVGLDPAAGFLHALRPGRPSFALDLMEELRAPLCDRFILTLFSKEQLNDRHFERSSLAVMLNETGRKKILTQWRTRKQDKLTHPFLKEKIPIGLIPYAQALLFARVLRGDLDRYPPFAWR